MARIRTIKPEFFRHELLQDLAVAHGAEVMLVFAGLWGHCDSYGRFEWRPRQLKLDILPFLPFDMAEVLDILASAGLVRSYEVGGKRYGVIDSFREHQRLTGKEAQDGVKYPEPTQEQQDANCEALGKQRGNTVERPVAQEKEKEKEREREKEGKGEAQPPATQPATAKRGSRLPADWSVSPQQVEWAMCERGWPEEYVRQVADKFRDYWLAAPGQKGVKLDWDATWRNWVRNETGAASPPRASPRAISASNAAAAVLAKQMIFGAEQEVHGAAG